MTAEILPFRIDVPQPDLDDLRDRLARAWATLMSRLGYQRYGAQGGDWARSSPGNSAWPTRDTSRACT